MRLIYLPLNRLILVVTILQRIQLPLPMTLRSTLSTRFPDCYKIDGHLATTYHDVMTYRNCPARLWEILEIADVNDVFTVRHNWIQLLREAICDFLCKIGGGLLAS